MNAMKEGQSAKDEFQVKEVQELEERLETALFSVSETKDRATQLEQQLDIARHEISANDDAHRADTKALEEQLRAAMSQASEATEKQQIWRGSWGQRIANSPRPTKPTGARSRYWRGDSPLLIFRHVSMQHKINPFNRSIRRP